MDIERMQRISSLAKELVKRGMCSDIEEATKQAEIIINKNDPSISTVLATKQGQFHPDEMQKKPHNFTREEKMDTETENEMRMQLRKVSYQLNEQAKVIAELKNQLSSLINEINRLKVERVSRPIMVKEPGKEQTKISQEAVKKEPHAKVGNYSPDEITIEKFFYSGPK
ncbi:MAG: hypothetical protein N3D84_03200 [Candidatus Woesearchaeota archaeon]|nr:hypothetical protein [Candidatus Woesearchaeota archaeon]